MSLLSLPTELIEHIFSFCANATLIRLSQTCTNLNSIALHIFFRRPGKYLGRVTNGLLRSWDAPRETLEAVRAALFLENLSYVNWDFNHGWECSVCSPNERGWCPFCRIDTGTRMGPLKRTFDEIASLRAIFSRLEAKSVTLNLHKVDVLSNGGYFDIRPYKASRDLWRTAFVGLLDEVLENGCEILEVQNGNEIERMFATGNSKQGLPMAAVPHTPTTTRRNFQLKTMRVRSDMLLLPPFIDWTTSLLTSSACAATLTCLSIQPQEITIPSPFLESLDLPNLDDFEIKARLRRVPHNRTKIGIAKFDDVAAFLARHNRQLKKVFLYGVGLPGPRDRQGFLRSARIAAPIFNSDRDILPHLEDFTAHPAYIVWLLDLAISSSSRSFWLPSNTTLGNLTSIGITSEEYSEWQPQFSYGLFDKALSEVVRFCRWRNGVRGTRRGTGQRSQRTNQERQEKPLEIMLRFASEPGMHQWFTGHLSENVTNEQGPPKASILTQLTHISTLTISMSYSVKLSNETVDILPDWLALVSSSGTSSSPLRSRPNAPGTTLQRVKFVDHPFTLIGRFPGTDPDIFVKRVAERCVGLKWLQLDWDDDTAVDLDSVRSISPVVREGVERVCRHESRFWVRWCSFLGILL